MKFRASGWIMYDTAFRYMAASNPSLPWREINNQLYNNILKKKMLPFAFLVTLMATAPSVVPLIPRSTSPFVALQPMLNHLPLVQPVPQQARLNHPSPHHRPPSQPLHLTSSAVISTVASAVVSTASFSTSAATRLQRHPFQYPKP